MKYPSPTVNFEAMAPTGSELHDASVMPLNKNHNINAPSLIIGEPVQPIDKNQVEPMSCLDEQLHNSRYEDSPYRRQSAELSHRSENTKMQGMVIDCLTSARTGYFSNCHQSCSSNGLFKTAGCKSITHFAMRSPTNSAILELADGRPKISRM